MHVHYTKLTQGEYIQHNTCTTITSEKYMYITQNEH